jgi:hypothetical protein
MLRETSDILITFTRDDGSSANIRIATRSVHDADYRAQQLIDLLSNVVHGGIALSYRVIHPGRFVMESKHD